MPRTSPTRAWVRQYAESSLLDGTPPTVSMLRQQIINSHGVTPSTTTVTNELSLFWADLAMRIKDMPPASRNPSSGADNDDEPFELSTLSTELISTPSDQVAELTRLQYSNMELSAKAVRLSREVEQLQTVIEDKDNLLAQSIRAAGKAAREVEEIEEKLARLTEEAARNQAKNEAAGEVKMAALRKQFELVSSELDAERIAGRKAKEQLDGARRHLMLETDRIRSQAEAASTALKHDLETARIREAQYLQQRNRAMERVDELEQALEVAQRTAPSAGSTRDAGGERTAPSAGSTRDAGGERTAQPDNSESLSNRAGSGRWQPQPLSTDNPDAPAE
jgi:chaperonin cofactor prefoldin